jgi:hypothetical protein
MTGIAVQCQAGERDFLLSIEFGWDLRSTQLPVLWAPRAFSPGCEVAMP